jgi:hypothetical protein
MICPNDRGLSQPQTICSEQPAMSADHPTGPVSHDWHEPAKGLDALGDLANLLVRVSARIARVSGQGVDTDIGDRKPANSEPWPIVGDRRSIAI